MSTIFVYVSFYLICCYTSCFLLLLQRISRGNILGAKGKYMHYTFHETIIGALPPEFHGNLVRKIGEHSILSAWFTITNSEMLWFYYFICRSHFSFTQNRLNPTVEEPWHLQRKDMTFVHYMTTVLTGEIPFQWSEHYVWLPGLHVSKKIFLYIVHLRSETWKDTLSFSFVLFSLF